MRKLLLCSLFLVACSPTPTSNFVSRPIIGEQGFQTETEAVTAGITAAVKSSSEFERGGGILKGFDNKFYYTTPVGGSNPGEVVFDVVGAKGFQIVAVFHTHPTNIGVDEEEDQTQYFSGADVDTADRLHLDSYIGILKNHTISKFVPGHSPIEVVDNNKGDGSTTSVSLGESVGSF
jgi:hypothetical protein